MSTQKKHGAGQGGQQRKLEVLRNEPRWVDRARQRALYGEQRKTA